MTSPGPHRPDKEKKRWKKIDKEREEEFNAVVEDITQWWQSNYASKYPQSEVISDRHVKDDPNPELGGETLSSAAIDIPPEEVDEEDQQAIKDKFREIKGWHDIETDSLGFFVEFYDFSAKNFSDRR